MKSFQPELRRKARKLNTMKMIYKKTLKPMSEFILIIALKTIQCFKNIRNNLRNK